MSVVINGTSGITGNSGTLLSNSTIGVGAATPAASGAGITFPATQSASSDANTLDDYEEGTFTPTVTGGTTAGTTTYTTQRGFYTKIGRSVNISFNVVYTAATGTGDLNIGGLPFTASALGNNAEYTGTVMTGNLNLPNTGWATIYIYGNTGTSAQMYSSTDDAVLTVVSISNESASIWASITYFV
jgi:hypothetical protein